MTNPIYQCEHCFSEFSELQVRQLLKHLEKHFENRPSATLDPYWDGLTMKRLLYRRLKSILRASRPPSNMMESQQMPPESE